MNNIDTGTKLIARYDNVVPDNICNLFVAFIRSQIPEQKNIVQGMPWHNGDNIPFTDITVRGIRALVDRYRFLFVQLVNSHYKQIVYPHFADFVVWRKGMEMGLHKDNGYNGNTYLAARKYSMVAYLNDDYTGGETVVKFDDKEYVSVPKKGSVVIFKSNEECLHSVNKVIEGTRFTLATWFTNDIECCEVLDKY